MDEDILERLRVAVQRVREVTDGRSATGLTHGDADDSVGTIGTDELAVSTRCPCFEPCMKPVPAPW